MKDCLDYIPLHNPAHAKENLEDFVRQATSYFYTQQGMHMQGKCTLQNITDILVIPTDVEYTGKDKPLKNGVVIWLIRENEFLYDWYLDGNDNAYFPNIERQLENLTVGGGMTRVTDFWTLAPGSFLSDEDFQGGNKFLFEGNYKQFAKMLKDNDRYPLPDNCSVSFYMYSKNEPDEKGKFWNYDQNGKEVIWNTDDK